MLSPIKQRRWCSGVQHPTLLAGGAGSSPPSRSWCFWSQQNIVVQATAVLGNLETLASRSLQVWEELVISIFATSQISKNVSRVLEHYHAFQILLSELFSFLKNIQHFFPFLALNRRWRRRSSDNLFDNGKVCLTKAVWNRPRQGIGGLEIK